MTTHMQTDTVLELNQKILSWCDEYSQELSQDIAVFRREHAIDATEDLRHSFNALEEESRLLQIGVIGRVKSGKSSLLNALVFNGENILPRAATPMTAALTTLTWAESFHARVDFYSQQDQDNLRAVAQEYDALLQRERDRAREQLQSRNQNRGNTIPQRGTDADLHERVEKTAQRAAALTNPTGAAAHDQWQRIKKANIDPATLDRMSTLRADNVSSVASKIKIPEFELGEVDLGELKTKQKRLRGDEADRFLKRASTLMADLRQSIGKTITELSKSVSAIPRTLGGDLFSDMQQRITQLEHDIENKTQSLDRLQRMVQSLDAIKV